MAKKNKGTFSYIETQQALEAIATTATRESLPYELLRIFCGYSDAAIARVKDGRGNDAKDACATQYHVPRYSSRHPS